MFRKLIPMLAIAAAAAFCAENYKITLFQPSVVTGTELKAGAYRLQVTDQKVVLYDGKKPIDLAAKIETGGQKFSATTVRYSSRDGKAEIAEIRLGGTSTRLIFNQ
jgi:hypothetical protein